MGVGSVHITQASCAENGKLKLKLKRLSEVFLPIHEVRISKSEKKHLILLEFSIALLLLWWKKELVNGCHHSDLSLRCQSKLVFIQSKRW